VFYVLNICHIDRPALLPGLGSCQTDLQGSPGINGAHNRVFISLYTLDKMIDLSTVGRAEALLKPGHYIVINALPGQG